MKREMVLGLFLVGVLYGCNNGKKEEALRIEVDSLTAELRGNHLAANALQDVEALIDSIDLNRNALRTRMIEGTTLGDYTRRMRDINEYVKDAQKRIAFLENSLKSLKGSSSSYTGSLKKVRHELEVRNQELETLKDQVAKYRNLNDNLVQTVNLQKAEIIDKFNQLKLKERQIDTLEQRINYLVADAKMNEAESYFARAKAVEETANRTRFAPRKKRNTRKEALELYKKAATYGSAEAMAKVTELEKKI